MSRVIQFSTYGGPEVLEFKDVDLPSPGPGEVRIRVKALGLNRAESMWRTGEYIEEVKLPVYRLRLFVGVGMTVAYHPLRRSVRALLTHTALYERVPFCNSFRVV